MSNPLHPWWALSLFGGGARGSRSGSPKPLRSASRRRSDGRARVHAGTTVAVAVAGLAISLLTPLAAGSPLAGSEGSTLQREPQLTPQEIGDGTAADLLYADPTEGLSQVAPPEGNSTGSAQLEYPLVLPKGRGMTPELALTYESGGASSWAGLGWDLSVGDISVDTQWGSPLFCPRATPVPCATTSRASPTRSKESSSCLRPYAAATYRGSPSGRTTRAASRPSTSGSSGTAPLRKTTSGRSSTSRERSAGTAATQTRVGRLGAAGTRTTGAFRNDKTRDAGSILTDSAGNGYRLVSKRRARRRRQPVPLRVRHRHLPERPKPATAPDGRPSPTASACAERADLRQARLPLQDPLHRRRRGGAATARTPPTRSSSSVAMRADRTRPSMPAAVSSISIRNG